MLAILLSALVAKSQIKQVGTIYGTSYSRPNLIHLNNGYKYAVDSSSFTGSSTSKFFNIYDLNGRLEKTISLPQEITFLGFTNPASYYQWSNPLISDHLFDSDDEIEFIVSYNSSNHKKLLLMDENSQIIDTLGSINCNPCGSGFNLDYFSDGSTFSKLLVESSSPNRYLIYDLPGYLPCESCSNNTTGSTKSLAPMAPSGMRVNVAPNPSAGEFTFHYQLPKGKNNAELTITNLNGVIVKTKKINNEIGSTPLLLNDLSSGIYIYTIQCEAERSTPQRIILTK